MPRNQTPSWGPLPYDERDLDAVLSGDTDGIAIGLRPVAQTLAALRAAPAPAELSGEAAARATFRAFALADDRAPAGSTTLVLPADVLPVDVRAAELRPVDVRPADARRRRRRPGVRPARRGVAGLAAVAVAGCAVVAAVVGVATGAFSESGSPHGAASLIAGPIPPTPAGDAGSHGVDGQASTVPSPVPQTVNSPAANSSPAPGAVDGAGFCREFYSFDAQHESQSSWAYQAKLFAELSARAGGSGKIVSYCQSAAGLAPPAHVAWPPGSAIRDRDRGPARP